MKKIFLFILIALSIKDTLAQTVTDIDGNVYNTVTIGTQIWMKENLETSHFRNGASIPTGLSDIAWGTTTSGAWAVYTFQNITYGYGKFYNWYAVTDSRNVCPIGWHIPTDAEWTTLTNFLGGESVAGSKMKEIGNTHWQYPNTDATNSSGFTGLPGGLRKYDGTFDLDSKEGYWWSSSEGDAINAWSRNLDANVGSVLSLDGSKLAGLSVRCVKDTTPYYLSTQPKIYTSKGVLGANDIQLITGSDFTTNGQINLFIKNSVGDFIPTNNSFTYLPNGGFTYQLPITSSMTGGEYQIDATDIVTGVTTPTIKFIVNTSSHNTLWINKPLATDTYLVNQLFQVQWGDYINKSIAIGKSGFVQKKYKVAVSNDNGATWFSESDVTINNAIPGVNNNNFATTFGITTAGAYRIKITDSDNPSDFNISDPFTIVTSIPKGFNYSYEWDKSSPLPDGMPHPIGLAADGTSRIFIKLLRSTNNSKVVSKIVATISSIGNTYSGIDLLGKIMYAPVHLTYNEDANTASLTSCTWPAVNGNEFWFWLVAPNDFTQDPSDQRSERKIKVDFIITYSDNSTEVISTDQTPLDIVRPPLFLVHGINDDAGAFAKTRYDVDGTPKYFSTDRTGVTVSNSWKIVNRLNLYNYGSFGVNAEVILGTQSGDNAPNSFQASLKAIHQKGYACNKVDYVAHSMGGCIARTIINLYVDSYQPPVNSGALYKYKNYSQGFINKFITLNTPHNGAEIADLVNDIFPNGVNPINNPLLFIGRSITPLLNGFLINGGLLNYKVSPAVKDLQAYHGGIRFNTTYIKNHLIGSVLDNTNSLSESYIRSNSTFEYNLLYSILGIPIGLPPSINTIINDFYHNNEYLNKSDYIVPISSQLLGKDVAAPDLYEVPFSQSNSSIVYGLSKYHSNITNDTAVGTRIMHLLNAPINSAYFDTQIPRNPNQNGDATYKHVSITSFADSLKSYFDKAHIAIETPNNDSIVLVNSSITIQLSVADTVGLQQVHLMFQGQLYQSDSKESPQAFNIQVNSNQIGYNKVVAEGIYDSSGYTVNHIDTITLNVKSGEPPIGFYISSKSNTLNPGQTFQPIYNAVYNTYTGVLNNDIDSLSFSIADTNVVRFDSSSYQFIAKDTGTTYIVFNYKGFLDTAFIYLSLPQQNSNITFNGKIFLEGAYNTSTGMMNNTLNSLGILQANATGQSYNTAVYNYAGTENVSSTFFSSHADIVDWVLLELRDSASHSIVMGTRAAFVKQDGNLVDTDGVSSQITFNNVTLGKYFIVIHHRNHLGIRSSIPVDFTSGSGSYDFTTSANKTYQNQSYTSTVQIGSVWAMRAGNANSNNSVKYNGPGNDQNQILNIKLSGSLGNILNDVYAPEDINMNGNVKWNGPGNDQNFLLNTILNGSLSTIYLEQL